MYNVTCKVCGTPFEAVNSNYCICSDKCRKIIYRQQSKEHAKIYYSTQHGKSKRKQYYNEHYTPVTKKCSSCGSILSDGRQSYCLDCLLNDYKNTHSKISKQRLYSRGYDINMIETAIQGGLIK